MKLVVSCEHASADIPTEYQFLFSQQSEVLTTHRAYDIGAIELFTLLAQKADFGLQAQTSRLLVELNRSLHHSKLFSEFTQDLDRKTKNSILDHYYHPYRNELTSQIQQAMGQNQRVLHISVHSFTPVLNGERRQADIGLLYDSTRLEEKNFSRSWKQSLLRLNPELNIRYNYPYAGKADGFTTHLRKQFSQADYLGIELEVNQHYPLYEPKLWQTLQTQLATSLQEILSL